MAGTFGDADDLDWGGPVEKADDPSTPTASPPVTPPAAQQVPTQPPVATPSTQLPAAPVARQPMTMPSRPVQQAPAAPIPTQAPTPAPAQAPAPAAPVPAPEPQFIAPTPAVAAPAPVAPTAAPVAAPPAAEPVYVPPAPAPEPPAQRAFEPTPDHAHVPVSAPQQVQPVEPSYWDAPVDPVPTPAVPSPVADPSVNPDTDDEDLDRRGRGKGKKKSRKGKKAADPGEKVSLFAAGRGGRGRLMIMRGLFWVVLGLLLLGGLKNIVTPNEQLSIPDVAEKVVASTGTKGYPVTPAGAFATRFVATYLTYDPDGYEQRVEALKAYSIEAGTDEFSVEPEKAQKVLAGPFLVDSEVKSKNEATLTVASLITGGKWVYLAVPVFAADDTTFVIAGVPGFVSAPGLAVVPALEETPEIDNELSDELSIDLFPGFFKAWAASNVTELDRYTTADPTANTETGLRGVVTLVEVEEVKIVKSSKTTRQGTALVVWQTPTGVLKQQYRITIAQGDDARWSIADIRGGVVRESGTTEDVQPTPEPGTDVTSPDGSVSGDAG